MLKLQDQQLKDTEGDADRTSEKANKQIATVVIFCTLSMINIGLNVIIDVVQVCFHCF